MFVRLFTLSVISAFLLACASTSTEAPEASADTATSASVGSVAPDNSEAQLAGEGVPELDASDMPQTASVEEELDPNEIVCKRQKQTGSKFMVKTCMTRAEMQAREERDQELMESMRRRQSGGSCALNQDC